MYACVLIPRELSLLLSLQPSPRPSSNSNPTPSTLPRPSAGPLTSHASVWSNSELRPGTVYYPDEGEVRLDRLDDGVSPPDDQIRRSYGGYDTLLNVQGQQIRQCNWVRFVRATLDPDSANVISSKVRGQAFFQVTRAVKVGEEIVVLFHAERPKKSSDPDLDFTDLIQSNLPKATTDDHQPWWSCETAGHLGENKNIRSKNNQGNQREVVVNTGGRLGQVVDRTCSTVVPSHSSREEDAPTVIVSGHSTQVEDKCSTPQDLSEGPHGRRSRSDHLEHLEQQSTEIRTLSPAPSPPYTSFPQGIQTIPSLSLTSLPFTPMSSSSSFVTSSLSSLSLPTMRIAPGGSSLFPASFALGGPGLTRSMYERLTGMSTERQHCSLEYIQQQQHKDQQQQQQLQLRQRRNSCSHLDPKRQPRGERESLRERSPLHSIFQAIPPFNVKDGVFTSTPISMVTPHKNTKIYEALPHQESVKTGRPGATNDDARNESTPIACSASTAEKMNAHNPRSLNFGASFSSSSSEPASMSLSIVSHDSPCTYNQQNESKTYNTQTDNVNDSLQDFSASSPMFTSGSSNSREISSASDGFAGDVSGINLSMDKEIHSPGAPSYQFDHFKWKDSEVDIEAGTGFKQSESEDYPECARAPDNKSKPEVQTEFKEERDLETVQDSHRAQPAENFVQTPGTGDGSYHSTDNETTPSGDKGNDGGPAVSAQEHLLTGSVDSTVDEHQLRENHIDKDHVIVKDEEHSSQPTSDGQISSSNQTITTATAHQSEDLHQKLQKNSNFNIDNKEESFHGRGLVTEIDSQHYSHFSTNNHASLNYTHLKHSGSQMKDRTTLEVPRPVRTISSGRLHLPKGSQIVEDMAQQRPRLKLSMDTQQEPQNLSMAVRLNGKPQRVDIRIPEAKPPTVSSSHPRDQRQPMKRCRERTWWPCDVCGKKFDRPSLLKRHTRTHTGEKPHACDVCGKAFSTSSSLNTHRRIHSGEKPHQCKICGKRFTASSNLYYHRMTHNKEKPHKCELCSKSFPTPGDLRSHMYIHNGSWPFRCDVCNRGFSKQTNLKNHMLLHSGDKPHECSRCGKKFALLCNLKTHLKTHEHSDSSDASGSQCSVCGGPHTMGLDGKEDTHSVGTAGEKWHGSCSACKTRPADDSKALIQLTKRSHSLQHHHLNHHQKQQQQPEDYSTSAASLESAPPKKRHTDFSISKLTAADDKFSQRNSGRIHPRQLNVAPGKPEKKDSSHEDFRDTEVERIRNAGFDAFELGRHFGSRRKDFYETESQPLKLISSNLDLDTKWTDKRSTVEARMPSKPSTPVPPMIKEKDSFPNQDVEKFYSSPDLTPNGTYHNFLAAAAAAAAAAAGQQQFHHHHNQQQQQLQLQQQSWFLSNPQLSATAYNQLAYPLLFSAQNLQQIGGLSTSNVPTAHIKPGISSGSPFHPLDPNNALKTPASENLQQQQLLRLARHQHSQQQLLPLLPQPPQNLITSAAGGGATSGAGGGVIAPKMPISFQLPAGPAHWALASHTLTQGF